MSPSTHLLPDEAARLARLHELLILDTEAEPMFDDIALLACKICETPIALVSLVDAERQWFKANVGLEGTEETPRGISFCTHAITADELFEVQDAAADPRFADNPLVTGPPGIRFYAGAPLILPSGERVGTLCAIDHKPRALDAAQAQLLRSLAGIASQALVMRRELINQSLSARSEYERTIERSEAHYRALVEGQSEFVSLAERDGTLVYVNPAYARHYGRTPAQMIGANLLDYVAPRDHEMVRKRIDPVFSEGATRNGETRMIGADGTERWISWTNTLQHDERGRPLLHSVGHDITERKRLQQRVADSERFVRHVTDSLPLRIAYVDAARRYRFTNRAHCESLGLSREEIIGRTRTKITPSGPHDALIAQRIDAALAGNLQQFEYEEEEADGTKRLIEGRIVPDRDENGQVLGYVSTNIDVTERAAAERGLRELNAIFENTTDSVAQTDARGKVVYMNPAARRVLDLAPDAPVTHVHFSQFYTPETNRLFEEVILPALKTSPVWIGETAVLAAHGRVVPMNHMVLAHRDADGRVLRYSSVMRDISAELEAKRETMRQTATLRSVTETIPSSVAVFGADGRYRFVNRAFERWSGLTSDRIIGRIAEEVLGAHEFERRRPWIEKALAGQAVTYELDYSGSAGSYLSINYLPLRPEGDAVEGFVVVMHDITQQKLEQKRLLRLSQCDALTGLLNRAGFEDAIESGCARGEHASLAILYIDLDYFKPVNDRYGHPVGDEALRLYAQRLGALVRSSDAVARLGGDEFAIALFDIPTLDHARHIADEVVGAARTPFQIGALSVQLGASVGIAFSADQPPRWRELIEAADSQLLEAKASGRGRYAALPA